MKVTYLELLQSQSSKTQYWPQLQQFADEVTEYLRPHGRCDLRPGSLGVFSVVVRCPKLGFAQTLFTVETPNVGSHVKFTVAGGGAEKVWDLKNRLLALLNDDNLRALLFHIKTQ